MPDIILHHYPRSPYAEKIRLALGLKGLAYRSVIVPAWMPKPGLVKLTGGYRRTPVMQVGADIFCDTLMILRQIERMHPVPTLFPGNSAALATLLGWGLERSLFLPAVGITIGLNGHTYPRGLIEDRLPFFGFSIEPAEMLARQALFVDRLNAQFPWLEGMLADGRPFLLGSAPSTADLCAYHPLWHLRRNGGEKAIELLPALGKLMPWMDRIAAIGHGDPEEFSASEALAIAKRASPMDPEPAADAPGLVGFALGDEISMTPDDSGRDPVLGTLLAVSGHSVVLRRMDAELGGINVHFPRAGFDAAAPK